MQSECRVTPHALIPDVLTLTPDIFVDHRGEFVETYRCSSLYKHLTGISRGWEFSQGNLSVSAPWTVRGLHYQLDHPQGKLINCVAGSIFDVAVDLRPTSPTFGKSATQYIDAKQHKSIWIPPGFAHGFMALSDGATVSYQCTTYFDEASARAIYPWSVKDIKWPHPPHSTLITAKDRGAPYLDAAMQEILERDA